MMSLDTLTAGDDTEERLSQSQNRLAERILQRCVDCPEQLLRAIAAKLRSLAELIDAHDDLGERSAALLAGWASLRERTRMRCL